MSIMSYSTDRIAIVSLGTSAKLSVLQRHVSPVLITSSSPVSIQTQRTQRALRALRLDGNRASERDVQKLPHTRFSFRSCFIHSVGRGSVLRCSLRGGNCE